MKKPTKQSYAIEASPHSYTPADVRHPALQGIRRDVYEYVMAHPDSTRDDVSRGLQMKTSTVTARIKELIDEGYLYEPRGVRKENKSGVRAKVLRVTERKQGGKPLDKVRVEVTLTVGENGIYGATAKVVGGKPQSGRIVPIRSKAITMTAPHPDTYSDAFAADEVVEVSRYAAEEHQDDIIDAPSYTVVD